MFTNPVNMTLSENGRVVTTTAYGESRACGIQGFKLGLAQWTFKLVNGSSGGYYIGLGMAPAGSTEMVGGSLTYCIRGNGNSGYW